MPVMTMKQYKRLKEAKAAGDTRLVEQIRGEKYGEDSTVVDVELVGTPSFDDNDILSDLAAGLDKKEIATKYGISGQKIASIIKKAK